MDQKKRTKLTTPKKKKVLPCKRLSRSPSLSHFLLWGLLLLSVVIVSLTLQKQRESGRFRLLPGQSRLFHREGVQLLPHDEQVFLVWEITETPHLIEGRKRLAGVVRWNEESGAAGEPVQGMPLVLYQANAAKRALTPIASTVTDHHGRFVIETEKDQKILLGGFLGGAKNIPAKVRAVLGSRKRPATANSG